MNVHSRAHAVRAHACRWPGDIRQETKPLPEIPRPLVHPDEPTPDQLATINYRNQLQRESNKVAMRRYNYELYKAALRFVVAKYVPFSAAMRLKTDWDCMHK